MSANSDGTNRQTLSSHSYISAFTYDATTLYFAAQENTDNYGIQIFKLLMSGGSATSLLKNRGDALAMTNDSQWIYWTEYNNGIVARCDKTGSNAANLATGQASPEGIGIVSSGTPYLFWTTTANISNGTGGSVWRSAPDGTGAKLLAAPTVSDAVYSLVVDNFGTVYYGTYDHGVWRVPSNGVGNAQIAPFNGGVYGEMALGGGNVYWAASGTLIGLVGEDGTHVKPADTLLSGQSGISGVAVDSSYVYFTTSGTQANSYADGAVYRVAK
jgi:hypothetical protein